MKDKRFAEARRLLLLHGGEYLRDTRHGQLYQLGGERIMLHNPAHPNTGDHRAARNTLAKVKRLVKGLPKVLKPEPAPWKSPAPQPPEDVVFATLTPEVTDLVAELVDDLAREEQEQEQEQEMPKKKTAKKVAKKKAAKKTTKKVAAKKAPGGKKKKTWQRSDTELSKKVHMDAVKKLVAEHGTRQGAADAAAVSLATLDRVTKGDRPVRKRILEKVVKAANGEGVNDSGKYKRKGKKADTTGSLPLAERIADVLAARLTGTELPAQPDLDDMCQRIERMERVILALGEQLGVVVE